MVIQSINHFRLPLLFASVLLSNISFGANDLLTTPAAERIKASGEYASVGEGRVQAFDNNQNTKWLTFDYTGWLSYEFPYPAKISQYTITSGNDEPLRDPKSWQLEGSADGIFWTSLDSRSNETFANRFQRKTYSFSNSNAFKFYRLNVSENSGAGILQLADLGLFGDYVFDNTADLTQPIASKITASDEYAAAGEGRLQAFDNQSNTKWLVFNSTGWLGYTFDQAKVIDAYTITSANDVPRRDPKNWQLLGSNDGTNWTTLDSRSNEVFTTRFQTRSFILSNNKAFRYYRLQVTANNGSQILQLAELQLISLNPNGTTSSSSSSSSKSSLASSTSSIKSSSSSAKSSSSANGGWANVASPGVDYRNDNSAGAQLFRALVPDSSIVSYVDDIAQKVAQILYVSPSEVPAFSTLELHIESWNDDPNGVAWKAGNPPRIIVNVNGFHLERVQNAGGNVAEEVKGVLFHEMTHAYQHARSGVDISAIEGTADAVRYLAGYIPLSNRRAGGSWTSSYQTTGFFLVWIQQQKGFSRFVHDFNQQAKPGTAGVWSWDSAIFNTTGQHVQLLWDEYQTWLKNGAK